MSDLAATNCGCDNNCGDVRSGGCGCMGNNWIWIIILLFCCGNNNGCGCDNDNNSCWWIILLLLFCGNGCGSNFSLGNSCGC